MTYDMDKHADQLRIARQKAYGVSNPVPWNALRKHEKALWRVEAAQALSKAAYEKENPTP